MSPQLTSLMAVTVTRLATPLRSPKTVDQVKLQQTLQQFPKSVTVVLTAKPSESPKGLFFHGNLNQLTGRHVAESDF